MQLGRPMFYMMFHTFIFSLYYRMLGMLFASLIVPSYCPIYEHIETYMTGIYTGRQMEIDDESRITIARNATSWIWYQGYLLGVCFNVEDNSPGRTRKFLIWALRRTTIENFVNNLHKKHGITDVVQVRTCGAYDWHVKQCPVRPVISVLAPAPIKAIIEDAQQFINSRQRYTDLGIPYRRGYLLYGLPGTGKTTCAYVLSSELKRPLCFLSLTNRNANDDWLIDILTRAPEGAIILIDDYDRFVPSTTNEGITIAGLLNALDGIVAQTGKIVILVANDISSIPDAILRPGRIDRRFLFTLTETSDASSLFERFHGTEHKELFIENFKSPRSAASIVAHLMRYESGIEAAETAGAIL